MTSRSFALSFSALLFALTPIHANANPFSSGVIERMSKSMGTDILEKYVPGASSQSLKEYASGHPSDDVIRVNLLTRDWFYFDSGRGATNDWIKGSGKAVLSSSGVYRVQGKSFCSKDGLSSLSSAAKYRCESGGWSELADESIIPLANHSIESANSPHPLTAQSLRDLKNSRDSSAELKRQNQAAFCSKVIASPSKKFGFDQEYKRYTTVVDGKVVHVSYDFPGQKYECSVAGELGKQIVDDRGCRTTADYRDITRLIYTTEYAYDKADLVMYSRMEIKNCPGGLNSQPVDIITETRYPG